jgi:heterodisulfide reductase subunit A
MANVNIVIDGKDLQVEEGKTILGAARGAGISIPTLCYHEAVKPFGGCRLCVVEVTEEGKQRLVSSCNRPVREGMVVVTNSEAVIKERRSLMEFYLSRAPNSETLRRLARECGLETAVAPNGIREEICRRCRLCGRLCSELIGASAIEFVKTETGVAPQIKAEACIACGACAGACPSGEISLEDYAGRKILHREARLGPNKAIALPIMQAVPNVPFIDKEHCIHFKTGKCGLCQSSCERQAIDFEMPDTEEEIEVGNIILATGFDVFDPGPIRHYGYGKLDNVVTSFEFEKLVSASGPTGGQILLSDGTAPRSIAIVHCVGSRDKNYHEYCSRVCCMYSLKYSHLIKEKTGADVYEMYIDMRCFGKGYEEFYKRLSEEGVTFIRGKVAEVTENKANPSEGKLMVLCDDTLLGSIIHVPVDMVILSVALEAPQDASEVGRLFNISRGADGFFLEKHPKLDPIATTTDGVFVAGCCQGAKDIPDTVAQASAAAARVLSLISRGSIEIEAVTAIVDEKICTGCQTCLKTCPYSAITYDEKKQVCRVNDALCKGCGACVAACPSDSISLQNFTNEQIVAEMEGLLSEAG